MLQLELSASGYTFSDIELAVQEALNKIQSEYRNGMDSNDDGDYSFSITGDEEPRGECDILCDESRGIYIPQAFAEMYGDRIVNEKGQDRTEDTELDDLLQTLGKGPGEHNEWYWDAMIEIEQNYLYKDSTGKLWDIEQNGDLWAYEHGKRRPEGHDGE